MASSNDDLLIKAENVGKIFCRDLRTSLWYGLKDSLRELTLRPSRKRDASGELVLRRGEFWANRNVCFELRRGESLGLIGHNGAGKTTLLKMLNGVIRPDTGRIEIRGQVGALIALGAGFNPILTGRENIFVNGSVLGLNRREIEEKFDEIVEFSELAEFLDTPVRNYSSGMQVRLGFAVASALSPQILLLDEVLAVGDLRFRAKCYNRLSELRASGVSLILVTHQLMDLNRYVDRCVYLEHGEIIQDSNTDAAVRRYLVDTKNFTSGAGGLVAEEGTGRVQINDISFGFSDGLCAFVSYRSLLSRDVNVCVDMSLYQSDPELIKCSLREVPSGHPIQLPRLSAGTLRIAFPSLFAQTANWMLSISIWGENHGELYCRKANILIPAMPVRGHFGTVANSVAITITGQSNAEISAAKGEIS